MSFAHDAADRIVLLRHGVIAENGTPAEVMDESQDPETIESSAIQALRRSRRTSTGFIRRKLRRIIPSEPFKLR